MSEVIMNIDPNADNSTSQNAAIAQYLKSGRALTPGEAWTLFGCARLAARIHDLRNRGLDVRTEIILVESATGRLARVAEYWLEVSE